MITGRRKKLYKRTSSPLSCISKCHSVSPSSLPFAILPHHQACVTKLEQHTKFVDYDRKVVRFAPDKLSTFGKLEQLGSNTTLDQLFHKFQKHRVLFDEVIKSSGVFGATLQEIKSLYDRYVCQHIERISEESLRPVCLYQSRDIEKLRIRVNKLEEDVTALMKENSRLEDVLQEETDSYYSTKALAEAPVVALSDNSSGPIDFCDKVESIQLQIVKQRQLTQSCLDQRVGKVPLSVVRNLEHALKETEISIQKLDKHNSFLETRIQELTKQLEILLNNTQKTKPSTKRKLWSVLASNLPPTDD